MTVKTFGKLKNGELFLCYGMEFVKVSAQGAISITPLVTHFSSGAQVVRSDQKSTRVANWKYALEGTLLKNA